MGSAEYEPRAAQQQTLDLPFVPPDRESTVAWEPSGSGTQPAPGRADRPRLAGYDVGEQLGRGGMGVVYRSTRHADGAGVAIKTITPARRGSS